MPDIVLFAVLTDDVIVIAGCLPTWRACCSSIVNYRDGRITGSPLIAVVQYKYEYSNFVY